MKISVPIRLAAHLSATRQGVVKSGSHHDYHDWIAQLSQIALLRLLDRSEFSGWGVQLDRAVCFECFRRPNGRHLEDFVALTI